MCIPVFPLTDAGGSGNFRQRDFIVIIHLNVLHHIPQALIIQADGCFPTGN